MSEFYEVDSTAVVFRSDYDQLKAENERLKEFIKEVASAGYPDSKPESLLEWVQTRARVVLDEKGGEG